MAKEMKRSPYWRSRQVLARYGAADKSELRGTQKMEFDRAFKEDKLFYDEDVAAEKKRDYEALDPITKQVMKKYGVTDYSKLSPRQQDEAAEAVVYANMPKEQRDTLLELKRKARLSREQKSFWDRTVEAIVNFLSSPKEPRLKNVPEKKLRTTPESDPFDISDPELWRGQAAQTRKVQSRPAR